MSVSSKIAVLGLLMALAGCVPAVIEVYEAPAISGVIIDGETLQPVAGAVVQNHPRNPAVTSDAGGYFELPSVTTHEGAILMPASMPSDFSYLLQLPDSRVEMPIRMMARVGPTERVWYAPILLRPWPEELRVDLAEGLYAGGLFSLLRERRDFEHCPRREMTRDLLSLAAYAGLDSAQALEAAPRIRTLQRRTLSQWQQCLHRIDADALDLIDQSNIDSLLAYLEAGVAE